MDVTVQAAGANPAVQVARLSGRLDVQAADSASSAIMNALSQAAAGLILDLEKMSFISSAGLRVLMEVRKKADSENKKIALISAGPTVYKIFKIAALDRLLHFFDNEAEALQALWPQA